MMAKANEKTEDQILADILEQEQALEAQRQELLKKKGEIQAKRVGSVIESIKDAINTYGNLFSEEDSQHIAKMLGYGFKESTNARSSKGSKSTKPKAEKKMYRLIGTNIEFEYGGRGRLPTIVTEFLEKPEGAELAKLKMNKEAFYEELTATIPA